MTLKYYTLFEIFPFLLVLIETFVELTVELDLVFYFKQARLRAISHLREKLFPPHPDQSQEKIDLLEKWEFNCFRDALIRRSQSNFFSLLLIQCILSVLLLSSRGDDTLQGSIYTLYGCIFILFGFLVVSIQARQPFAWFHMRYGKMFHLPWWRAVLGRLAFLSLIGTIIICQLDLWVIIEEIILFLVDQTNGFKKQALFALIFPLAIMTLFCIVTWISVRRRKKNNLLL